jgi:hypothetical protein
MMKRGSCFLKTLVWALTVGMVFAACASTAQETPPAVKAAESAGPVELADTTWEFSAPAGGITYDFAGDGTYAVTVSGLPLSRAMTLLKIAGRDGTGTYSISGNTATLNPNGGAYIAVNEQGDVQMKGAESFTVTVKDDSFTLDAITYKKVR